MILKQSTAVNIPFFMVDSTDSITGKTGLSPTVTLSKDGGSFAGAGGSVSEIGNGWYYLSANTTDTGTLKSLVLHATAAGADPFDETHQVVAYDPYDSVRLGLTSLPNASAGATNGLPLSVDSSGRVDVLKINGTSQTARDIGASVLLSPGTGAGQLDITSGVVKSNLSQILGTALTETAGQIAAGFKKFFNVASPTSTMNEITLVDTTTAVTNAVSGVSGNVTGSVGSVTGTVSANLVGIIATALTESSAGYLAAAFKKFFNLATPTSTMNEITLVDTVTTYTGNTPQTGDAFARLGAPAGASIAADLAEIESETDGIAAIPTTDNTAAITAIKAKTDNLPSSPAAIEFKKNTAYNNFVFPMQDASGNAVTGATVTGVRSIDGAATAATQAVTEVGNGLYKFNMLAADLNGSNIAFVMSATGCLDTRFTVVTES